MLFNYILISGRRIRLSRKSFSTDLAQDAYTKTLLKKFMFQVHPDYFMNFKQQQDVNSRNWNFLQQIVDVGITTAVPKTLTFYLKPSELLKTPKKVQVATSRIDDSIYEILDTIGVHLPPKMKSTKSSLHYRAGRVEQSYSGTTDNIVGTDLLEDFLGNLQDRVDLIQLRVEMTSVAKQVEKDLLEITGLDSVEYQNSWSLQNNALLLHQIRLYILEHQSEFSFPWTGMKFIITKEVHHSWAIDYSERCLRVDCCDISAHWMNSLYLVNSQQINAMNRAYAATIKRKKDLGRFIQAHVQKQTKLKFATKDYCVVVEKGFTCSEYLFARFLLQFDVTLFGQESMLLPGVEPFENSNEVETIPKTIHVIIEEGHGTKVLESGDFRVDGTCSIDDCLQLVVNNLERSLSKKTIHVETLNHIGKLSKRVVSLLGLKSIKHGVGVDNQKYLAFLQQVEMYLILKNSQYHVTSIDDIPEVTNLRKGIFRSLQGLDVVVGHYCSIRDDGVCILQWEFDARAIMH